MKVSGCNKQRNEFEIVKDGVVLGYSERDEKICGNYKIRRIR